MRTEIINTLSTWGEGAGKEIAQECGFEAKDVAIELNAMLKDGLVEREKRKGNEYTYWLSNLTPTTAPTDPAPVFNEQAAKEVIAEVAQEAAVTDVEDDAIKTAPVCPDCKGSGRVRLPYQIEQSPCHCHAGLKVIEPQPTPAAPATPIEDQIEKEVAAAMAVHADPSLQNAISLIATALPKGISLGIFSDGSIDLVDAETDTTYLPAPENLRDCLDCLHKLESYKQSA